MVAQNIIMTVLNVIVLVALLVFGVYAVYNNKPNFELTPAHLYDQQMGQKYGIWVFICVIISWLVTLPGLFGPLSNTWNQILCGSSSSSTSPRSCSACSRRSTTAG